MKGFRGYTRCRRKPVSEFDGHHSVFREGAVKLLGFAAGDKDRYFGTVGRQFETDQGAVGFKEGLVVASEPVFDGRPVKIAGLAVVLDEADHEGRVEVKVPFHEFHTGSIDGGTCLLSRFGGVAGCFFYLDRFFYDGTLYLGNFKGLGEGSHIRGGAHALKEAGYFRFAEPDFPEDDSFVFESDKAVAQVDGEPDGVVCGHGYPGVEECFPVN